VRVCFLCSEFPPAPHGGIGTFVRTLAERLHTRGHEITVLGIYQPPFDLPRQESIGGVHVIRLPMPRGPFAALLKSAVLSSRVRTLVRENWVDLIETPDWQGVTALWPRIEVPVVLRVHGNHGCVTSRDGGHIGRWQWWCERRSTERATFLCAVSAYAGEGVLSGFNLMRRDLTVIHNGVELRRFVPIDERRVGQVVFSGTLAQGKGVLTLTRAWREVIRTKPSAVLHVYGKDSIGPYGRQMSEEMRDAAGADAARSIVFHGHVPWEELSTALDQARVAVFPSFSEAFSLAPLEAMAGGCPTISTKRASGPEMIEDGRDGLLVDPAAPDDIARAIISLLSNDVLSRAVGRGGYERVRRDFSIEDLTKVNEEYYRECIRSFRRSLA